jgi:hypothetical protein
MYGRTTHGHHVPIQLIQALWQAKKLAVGTLEKVKKWKMKSNSIPSCFVQSDAAGGEFVFCTALPFTKTCLSKLFTS